MHLLIDADDTLWEDAINFREAVYTLARILKEHHNHSYDHILDSLRHYISIQQNIDIDEFGLGPKCFFISLHKVLKQILAELELEHHHDRLIFELRQIEYDFYHKPIILRANVEATLAALRKPPYKLYLYTQGEYDHQRSKLERSNLSAFFDERLIIPFKTVTSLQEILDKHNIPQQSAVIIGNSTRSDINPAKELGLRTIHCKHPYTWERENHPMREDGPLTHVIDNFGDILSILTGKKEITI